VSATGCCGCYDVIDPCYPDRYNFAARREVCASLTPQVVNGHVLDQTVWNWAFEPSSDTLTPAGMERLVYMLRRRPCPDPTIYLATAGLKIGTSGDLTYDPAAPEKFAEGRAELDARRIVAIQKYLTAETAGRGLNFQVVVHDPTEPDLTGRGMDLSLLGWYNSFQGTLFRVSAGGGGAGGAGGGAGAGAVGGGVGR